MDINYKQLLKKYETESIENLQKWIQINSVYDEETSSSEHPFGKGVNDALEFIAELGKKEGFNVDRCDNYCTEISYGEGDLIAIYAHADVVPVSGKWNYEPFGAKIKDGVMYGRGTSDDKGPAMAAFYAMKALKDNNLIDGFKVSLVIGGNEESGSRCLEYYFHSLKKEYPKYGFTPDADFPLIYGEKGIGGYSHDIELNIPQVISFNGGVAANSVIDEASLVIKNTSSIEEKAKEVFSQFDVKYDLITSNDTTTIKVFGKSAHGSMPELGVNAGLILLRFLGELFDRDDLITLSEYYLEPTGKKMNAYYETEYLHNSTYNVGLINFENGVLRLIVNFRYPEGVDLQEVKNKINSLKIGHIDRIGGSEPLLIDPNSEMVQTLLKVYQEETGDYQTPMITIGGGTYARESKNTIAFGSAFPGRNDNIHSPDENIHIEDYLKSQPIYARAILELGKLK